MGELSHHSAAMYLEARIQAAETAAEEGRQEREVEALGFGVGFGHDTFLTEFCRTCLNDWKEYF